MASGRSSFFDKVLGRIGRLDAEGLQQVVERLARERKFLETLLHTIEDGVLVTDAQGRVLYFNQAASRLLGSQLEALTGQPITRLLPELDWDKMAALDPAGGQRVVRLELEVHFPRPRFLRLVATPVASEGKERSGVALILHDATEARQQTAEAVESERIQLLTLLAMSVAHEVGNPLNALHIHLQLMERELKKLRALSHDLSQAPAPGRRSRPHAPVAAAEVVELTDRLERFLGVAKGEITRLDYIVTHFLQAIRPTQPQARLASLNEVVRETLELLRPELENRGLNLETKLARHLPEASFDPAQIKQALMNLIKNSMQAMTKGGLLTLETSAFSDGVCVSVGDTGAGIPPEQLTRISEPFFTTKKKGSGLGLMVVYRIMREHGGRIDVDSAPGKGTVFRLWLPLLERRLRLLQAASPETEKDSGSTPAAPAQPAADPEPLS